MKGILGFVEVFKALKENNLQRVFQMREKSIKIKTFYLKKIKRNF